MWGSSVTYRYVYDAEGNRTAKFKDTNAGGTLSVGDTDITLYGYDQRNRLVSVSHVEAWAAAQAGSQAAFRSSGTALLGSDLELRYTYDYADRRIRRSIDADGAAGISQESVSFAAYAGGERTLEISRPNDRMLTDAATGRALGFAGQVIQRNFYGSGSDEILAVDKLTWTGTIVSPTPTTSTFWTFTDHQNSVRDIVSGTSTPLGQVVEHRQYDSFGRMVRQTTGPQAGAATTSGVGIDFGYAGRPLESRTGLSDNRARWYEPGTGKFINEDPSGFKGGDANLFRYVCNDPLNQVDPSGLTGKYAQSAGRSGVSAAGFGAYGAGGAAGLMLSGGSSTRSAAAPSGTSTYSLSSLSASVSRTAAASASPSLVSQPYASLMTTGRTAPIQQRTPTESSRWTANDREAKLASVAAYDVNDGGLLSKIGVNYGGQGSLYKKDGFSAHLTYSEKTKTYYLAFRGTEPNDRNDWWADIVQGLGWRSSQHDQAVDLADEVMRKLGGAKLEVTGHSLGGSLAAAAAYATKISATTFNPASLSPIYRTSEPVSIRSHVIIGDILSVGRTISMGLPDLSQNQSVRSAPGEIILHLPRSLENLYDPTQFHPPKHFPD